MEAEILFIMLLALIVLGPRRLPEIGRQIGKALAELRRAKYEFTRQIEEEIRKIEEDEAAERAKKSLPENVSPASSPIISTADGSIEPKGADQSENRILPPRGAPAGTVSARVSAAAAASAAEEIPARANGSTLDIPATNG